MCKGSVRLCWGWPAAVYRATHWVRDEQQPGPCVEALLQAMLCVGVCLERGRAAAQDQDARQQPAGRPQHQPGTNVLL